MTIPKSSSKQDPEFKFVGGFMDSDGLQIAEREHPDAEARFAMQLLSTNGVLMGDENGEDSSGRAKLRPMAPAVLVQRAFDIAKHTFEEARLRGCMMLLPSADEIATKTQEAREAADAAKEARRVAREERRKEPASA